MEGSSTAMERIQRNVKLSEVATFERAKKDKEYPYGATLLQISATKGQLLFHRGGAVGSQYAVIIPKDIHPYYLYLAMQAKIDAFMAKYQTGLNLQIDTLNYFTIDMDPNLETQRVQADAMLEIEKQEEQIQKRIDLLIESKKFFLTNLFPKEGKDVPDIRFKDFI